MRAAAVVVAILLCASCGDNLRGSITIVTDPTWDAQLREFASLTPYGGLTVGTDPGNGYQIVVVDDPAIPLEGYRIETETDLMRVHAHDVLGAQYGVSAVLESMGFRFRHPFDALVPGVPTPTPIDTSVHQPQIRVRGIHLHTLHPAEGYFAVWEPGAGGTNDAHRIIDWVIKNRGNYLQWVSLDNINKPDAYAAWQPFTRELIDYAHFRGIRVGLGVQLFGQSNLQLAFDLSDDKTGTVPIANEISARLPIITKDLPFDAYDLSFGEFFNAEPQKFVDSVNEVAKQLRTFAPQAELHALVHVGAEQKVQFMGEELIYYFLVKFTDPAVIADIHTVMFYNLFEPAGGAYQSDNFFQHRDYLRERMCAGNKGSYQPETAYWVAFDDSVPQFFPLYVRSRLHDLAELQKPAGPCGVLDQHTLFSTGWEWGYWLNDVASLRASYELTGNLLDALTYQLAPDLGPRAAALVERLANAQHDDVMIDKLTGYLVGRDSVIDLGRTLDIISQPDRVTFDQLAAGMGRAEVEGMLTVLARHIAVLQGLVGELDDLSLPDTRWSAELRAGFRIDLVRAQFVEANYQAAIAQLDGDPAGARRRWDAAKDLLGDAREVVHARHADLHDTHGRRLLDKTSNQTFYQFGYLYFADTLCYWQRELDQVGSMLGFPPPSQLSCFF
ncbi:hypothetical protein BH11MYX3_BH11MYX3_13690 [soil metagenome]